MRRFRPTIGLLLILTGLSGLVFTAMVSEDPVTSDASDGPSMETWEAGLLSAGIAATGVWMHRTGRR